MGTELGRRPVTESKHDVPAREHDSQSVVVEGPQPDLTKVRPFAWRGERPQCFIVAPQCASPSTPSPVSSPVKSSEGLAKRVILTRVNRSDMGLSSLHPVSVSGAALSIWTQFPGTPDQEVQNIAPTGSEGP
jgi:hypothetical protein